MSSQRSSRLLSLFVENKDKSLSFGHEIIPGLYLANKHALILGGEGEKWLRNTSTNAVICCAAEIINDVMTLKDSELGKNLAGGVTFIPMEEADIRKIQYSIEDSAYTVNLENQLREAAALINDNLTLGRRVIVACKYGYNRSASSVLAYFVLYRSMNLIDGLELIRSVRTKVYPNFETWPALLSIEKSMIVSNGESAAVSPSLQWEDIMAYHAWSPKNRH